MKPQYTRGERATRLVAVCLLLVLAVVAPATIVRPQDVPLYTITPQGSSITFEVDASVAIKGTFDKWNATLAFTSTDVSTGVLDIEIQAASVDTGSGLKNGKLKGADFFDVENNPLITFKSTKLVQNGPNTFEVDGNFTIRGVTKTEKLALVLSGKGTGLGTINGTMAFDRKNYGMNSGIPFIRIADRVDVTIALRWQRIGGPPLVFKQEPALFYGNHRTLLEVRVHQ